MSAMVETIKLAKSFGSIKAVDNLSFAVGKGEVLGFLGPNGAGKSTTMKILTCFLAPDAGTAKVCGHDILQNPLNVRKSIGYLPETAPAYAEMTVLGFLRFVARLRGLTGTRLNEAVEGVIEKCNLESVRHQIFETLSKGFKRRTSLAQALIHDPPVLIMDEPTDGLDPNQKHEVRRLIKDMAEEKCIILSTHILEEVDAVCTRAVIISSGRLIIDCTPEELRCKSPRHGVVSITIHGAERDVVKGALCNAPDVDKVETFETDGKLGFRVFPKKGKKVAPSVTERVRERGWAVDDFHVERGQLDEVFRALTDGGLSKR